jgi:hypothetical protein
MLPLFNDMPQVLVLVEDDEVFHRDPYPLAVYSCPNILINPSHARTCSFDEIQGTICHELIHAWLHSKGLDGTGEFLDDFHSEWFVKKALEINEKKIDSLGVDLDFLLATPKAVDIYNRVAGIEFAPHLRHRVRKTRKAVAANTTQVVKMFGLSKDDRFFSKAAIIYFSVVVTSLLLNKAHLIPEAVVSFVWWGSAVAGGVLFALLAILHRTR